MTSIEYSLNRDGSPGKSWNPIVGCNPVSRGCRNCWAARQAHRGLSSTHRGLTVLNDGVARWNGKAKCFPEVLSYPLHWKRPQTIVTGFMSDPFYREVSFEFLAAMFAVMAACPRHTFILLTKRDPRKWFAWIDQADSDGSYPAHIDLLHRYLRQYLGASTPSLGTIEWTFWPLPNVVLGVSCENRDSLYRLEFLRKRLAAIQIVSFGPLVESVQIENWTSIDGILVEGESGPGAEPMHPAWVRSLRDQAREAGKPFFFKGWGHWAPCADESRYTHGGTETDSRRQLWMTADGKQGHVWMYDDDGTWQNHTGNPPDDMSLVDIFNAWGKKRSGRLLDGRTYDALPWGYA
jgi:protein gp37